MLLPHGKEVTAAFLRNREEVLATYGKHLWPDESPAEQRKRMKATTNAFDMDASPNIWAKRFGNPAGRTLVGVKKTLSDGSKFSMEEYQSAQEGGTDWLWDNAGTGLKSFLKRSYPKADERKRRLRWKSYVLQEAEAVAREAKLAWCARHEVRVMSLQHDGIVTGKLGEGWDEESAAHAMQEEATQACGLEGQVKGEACWCDAAEDWGGWGVFQQGGFVVD